MIHLKLLEKEELTKPKTSRQREVIKIRAKINEIEANKPYKESIKQKAGKWRREKTQINKIRDKRGNITTNTNKIQRIIREYFENLYSSKLEILDEMDKFLDTYIS
jgi:hypothetical protein